MELVFLGTSSALPTHYRNHSALALKAFGEIILMDCGEGTQRQIALSKLSPMKISKILITHFHGDHFLGLPGMVQSMAFRGRKEPLHLFGPPGITELTEIIKVLGFFNLSFPLHPHELNSGLVLEEDDYRISCCQMEHAVPNLAYSIEEKRNPKFLKNKALELGLTPGPNFKKLQSGIPIKLGDKIIKPEQVLGQKRRGRKIVYSGDTKPCPDMIKFSDGADVLIHESTFNSSHQDKAVETGHSTSVDAAQIARAAKVKKLILTHISTRYQDTDSLEKEALRVFENSVVAHDLMTAEVERIAD
ncbi:MAG: ribonuclease Z [Methanobacteriaceae archaeon]|nr:ribonuclease Z [Methanobacteriaceae archaeon]